jgi:hypothetical protein
MTKQLQCVHSPISEPLRKPIFKLTVGKVYEAKKSIDPPGWELRDDDGGKEVFWDYNGLFVEVQKVKQ